MTEKDASQKKGSMRGCIFLFALQIILLLVWGAFFFALGVTVQYDQLPPIAQSVVGGFVNTVNVGFPKTVIREKTYRLTLDDGVLIEIVEIEEVSDIPALEDAEGDWWRLVFRVTNNSTRKGGVSFSGSELIDREGHRFKAGSGGFVNVNPTFTGMAEAIYQVPVGTKYVIFEIKNKSIPIVLQ